MRDRIVSAVLILLTAACGAASDQPADDPPAADAAAGADQTAAMASINAATTKYADPSAALADGFMRDPAGLCVDATMVGLSAETGAMGVHYVHPARLGLTPDAQPVDGTEAVVDWAEPEVLVYEPQADGTEKLVAVEYLVFKQAWDAANTTPPSFFGTPFVTMADDANTPADEAHGFTPHYELHVWTARENPAGMYAEFNPAVTCAHAAAHASH